MSQQRERYCEHDVEALYLGQHTVARPKHIRTADILREQIAQGRWREGEQLPGQAELAEELEVSMQTIQRAITLLRADGLVRTVHRVGAFVAPPHGIDGARERYRRARTDDEAGAMAPGERTEITATGVTEDPPPVVVTALDLDEDEPVAMYRTRIVYRGAHPVERSTSWWSADLLPECAQLLGTDTGPIAKGTTAYIEDRTGRTIAIGRDRVRARGATEEEAEALSLQVGDPVLEVHHRTHDEEGAPVEICIATFAPGQWRFEEPYRMGQEIEETNASR